MIDSRFFVLLSYDLMAAKIMLSLLKYCLYIALCALATGPAFPFLPGLPAQMTNDTQGPHDCDTDSITDSRDGYTNHYPTVRVGNQCWMAENLRYLPAVYPSNEESSIDPRYYVYGYQGFNVDEARLVEPDFHHYGVLYNWASAIDEENVCPVGWHLPNNAEWDTLITFMQSEYNLHNNNSDNVMGVGNALKSCRQMGHPDPDCNVSEHPRWNAHGIHYGFDEVDFGALPAGYRASSQNGIFFQRGAAARWWTENQSSHIYRISRDIAYVHNDTFEPMNGVSIRCIKSHYELGLSVSNPDYGTAEVHNDEPPPYRYGETVTVSATAAYGYFFDKWEGDTDHLDDGMTGVASITFTMPPHNVTLSAIFEPFAPHQCGEDLIDEEENNYATVAIGDRCWMAENLRYLPSVNPPNEQSQDEPRHYVYDFEGETVEEAIDTDNYAHYGVLYNWPAATESCPVGWELPSAMDWDNMADSVIDDFEDVTADNIGNALKSCRQLGHPEEDCNVSEHPRWDSSSQHGFDQVGFAALPGGYMREDFVPFWGRGLVGYYWQSLEGDNPGWRWMSALNSGLNTSGSFDMNDAFSVRCIQSIYTIEAAPNNEDFGSVTGSGDDFVLFQTVTLTAIPNTGYHFQNWTEEGDEVSVNQEYTFSLTGDRTLVANLATNTYTITASAGEYGSIDPVGVVTVSHFDDFTFEIEPDLGFHVESIKIDDAPVDLENDDAWDAEKHEYTFSDISQSHTIEAGFASITFTITSSAGENGTIDPLGVVTTVFGSNKSYSIIPDEGHHVDMIQVNEDDDGLNHPEWNAESSTYLFSNITNDHTIHSAFAINIYTLTYTAGPNGIIEGDTIQLVEHGGDGTLIEAIANDGFHFYEWSDGLTDSERTDTIVTASMDIMAEFNINTYTITATANNDTFGTTSGSGIYEHFDDVELLAMPNIGYHFDSWKENNDTVMDGDMPAPATYTFMAEESRDLTAVFEINTYNITATANDDQFGTVSGSSTYEHFDTVELIAAPKTGYHFLYWFENDHIVMDGDGPAPATYTFMAEKDRTLEAVFSINVYNITAIPNDEAFGTVTGGGTYNHFDTVELIASPNDDHHFVYWTENDMIVFDGESQAPVSYTFIADNDRELIAVFAVNTYTITATSDENGTIDPEGEVNVNHGEDQTFAMSNPVGYHLSDLIIDDNPVDPVYEYTFSDVQDHHTIHASFSVNTYTITVTSNQEAYGSVSGTGTYEHFSTAVVSATPETGYHLVNWLENEVVVSQKEVYDFIVEGPRDLLAIFAINTYDIIAAPNNTDYGSVQGTGSYNHFETVVLTAKPETGYHFEYWIENEGIVMDDDEPALASYTFTATEDRDLEAVFNIKTYNINAAANNDDYGSVTGSGLYEHSELVELEALPNTGYQFLNWLEDGDIVMDGNHPAGESYLFIAQEDRNLIAILTINEYTIAATPNNDDFGTTTGSGQYEHFETATLTATPNTGYHFVNWTENGDEVADEMIYEFEVAGPRNLVANFSVITAIITARAFDGGVIEPEGEIIVNYGENQEFTIIPETGHDIDDVIVDGWSQGPTASYVFDNVVEDHTIEAFFTPHIHIITATTGENGNINPTGEIEVTHGSSILFEIIPDEGFMPSELLIDGIDALLTDHPGYDPREQTFTFQNVKRDHSIEVRFRIDRQQDVFIPKAFIPSEQGLPANRMFVPDFTPEYRQGISDHTFKMEIHNRWGEKIFETEGNPESGWDGRINGETASQESYAYRISYEKDGKKQVLRGVVLLMR
jgi:uncharacterized protein (TIGR02145 family)